MPIDARVSATSRSGCRAPAHSTFETCATPNLRAFFSKASSETQLNVQFKRFTNQEGALAQYSDNLSFYFGLADLLSSSLDVTQRRQDVSTDRERFRPLRYLGKTFSSASTSMWENFTTTPTCSEVCDTHQPRRRWSAPASTSWQSSSSPRGTCPGRARKRGGPAGCAPSG